MMRQLLGDSTPQIVDVICKTAQIDKNKRFAEYLEEELKIIQKLIGVPGVVKSYGLF